MTEYKLSHDNLKLLIYLIIRDRPMIAMGAMSDMPGDKEQTIEDISDGIDKYIAPKWKVKP